MEGRRSSVTQFTKFSDMVGSGTSGTVGKNNTGNLKVFGTVLKKMAPRRASQVAIQASSIQDKIISFQLKVFIYQDHFKIRAKEADGKMTVRNIEGLRRGSEIMFTSPKKLVSEDGVIIEGKSKFGILKLKYGFENSQLQGYIGNGFNSGLNESRPSIFDRPGLGNLAFRKSMTASLYSFSNQTENQVRVLKKTSVC